jgi:GNAT superfamily N-acetyltransferase
VLYNRAFAFGLERAVTEAEVDAAIALYDRAVPFSIQPTPFAAPAAVHAWLDHRGLVGYFNWVRWTRDLQPAAPAHTNLAIDTIGAREAEEYLALARGIFHEPDEILPWMSHTIGRAGWMHYVARDAESDGASARRRGVAIAALFVTDGVGWLGWGGTLKSHRGRGAQSALIARRIDDARTAGCRLLTVETAEDLRHQPNASYRNVARAGFRKLCLRPSHAYFPAGWPPREPAG